jgi:acetolactate synthase small subunit
MPRSARNRHSFGWESEHREPFIGMKLFPLSRAEALCFVSTYDKPFLLSKLAGVLTIHDCDIVEADVDIHDGVVTDLFKIRIPPKYEPALLETMLIESLRNALKGETNIEKEVFLWEKRRAVIREQIVLSFKNVKDDRCVLAVNTSNKRGLLHKISWALSLGGMNIEKAIISTTQDMKVEDIFWIKHRQGEKITPQYQEKLRDLLEVIVSEGGDPLDQIFKKERNMIYRQQLERRASGLRTAQLYADAHLRLLKGLFDRIKLELDIQNHPILIGVYGGIGSGTIGFTSDIDCIFLYDGQRKEEYDKLKRVLKNEFKRISDLDVDESFLPCHINYFYLGSYDGESLISFDDFFNYVNYIAELRNETDNRLFEPQFFHFPWAFSLRFVGNREVLERFKRRIGKLAQDGNRKYSSLKAYVLREKGDEIKKDYLAYLKGKYFPRELEFFNTAKLKDLYRKRAYQEFIKSIVPYDAIKFVFRRGVFPLLYIVYNNGHRTDMGLLRKEHRRIRPAIDFMLKAFNVRKTLFIKGQWDINYFFYIMDSKSEREFCEKYLEYHKQIAGFVDQLVGDS